jgi:DnaJ-class molecular chaperone
MNEELNLNLRRPDHRVTTVRAFASGVRPAEPSATPVKLTRVNFCSSCKSSGPTNLSTWSECPQCGSTDVLVVAA